ncbi:hypothetical protein CryarDRAFT_3340 [Cryptosporangium arvum DSM 44712]|uniref:Uncharacterized protein n=1 Tax=Cryptosporangium arvum DSM 44712 TaxID=927661 RepID=A0A011AJK8_9ACTN|nr:hypothetical protein CryarDRAFT_3340 [Cryptosporangium arvum DSM 44712]
MDADACLVIEVGDPQPGNLNLVGGEFAAN